MAKEIRELAEIFSKNFNSKMPGVKAKTMTLESFKKAYPSLTAIIEKSMLEAYNLGAKNASDFINKK